MNIIQPTEESIDKSRAKEIGHGTIPLPMESNMLNIPSAPGSAFDDRSSVIATKWAFEQLVSQKQLMTTIAIPTNGTGTTPLFLFQNSWNNIQKLHFRNLSDLFFLKSWKWHLTFEFRSNFQEVGMMTIAYANVPLDAIPYLTSAPISYVDTQITKNDTPGQNGLVTAANITNHSLFSLTSMNQLPHVHVMLGENQDVECTFDWLSPFKSSFTRIKPFNPNYVFGDKYQDPNDPLYDMGFVYLVNTIPLTTASGVTPHATVRIWSHLTDVEYSGYVPQDNII
ncbi:putative capsid protein [Anoplolepis gracilipes virus 3]|nr:putative capsid protein [Anoplolepis gracilipes virus 3]